MSTQLKSVDAYYVLFRSARSTREGARFVAERMVARSHAEGRSSLLSTSEGSAQERRRRQIRRLERVSCSPHEKVESDESTKPRCREPDDSMNSAGSAKCSPDPESPGETGAHVT